MNHLKILIRSFYLGEINLDENINNTLNEYMLPYKFHKQCNCNGCNDLFIIKQYYIKKYKQEHNEEKKEIYYNIIARLCLPI